MKISDLVLHPEERIPVDDSITLVPYGGDDVEDFETVHMLELLVQANSVNEVRMVLTVLFGKLGIQGRGGHPFDL